MSLEARVDAGFISGFASILFRAGRNPCVVFVLYSVLSSWNLSPQSMEKEIVTQQQQNPFLS